jgi:insulysin
MIYLSSKDLEGKLDLIEPYFGTQYSVRSIPEDLLAETRHPSIKPLFSYKRLDLPVKNIFLPKDTSLVGIAENEPTKEPIKILETKQSTLWFLRDTQFKVPKAIVQLRIYCNEYAILVIVKLGLRAVDPH